MIFSSYEAHKNYVALVDVWHDEDLLFGWFSDYSLKQN